MKSGVLTAYCMISTAVLAIGTIKNTTMALGDSSPEAFVSQGGLYKALDLIEKEKAMVITMRLSYMKLKTRRI
jgi:hypothetical protein